MKYIHFVWRRQKRKDDNDDAAPCIFGPKLTPEQKEELFDAFYWGSHVQTTADMRQKCQIIVFSYKLYGYYIRKKDRYRVTKPQEQRRLVQNRNALIEHGTVDLRTRHVDDRQIKSRRGRKRKEIDVS